MGGGVPRIRRALEPEISDEHGDSAPYWAQDGVHEIYRDWRALLDEYPGERILAAEAWVDPLPRVAEVGAPRRDAPGLQLRLPRDAVGCRGPAHGHRRLARRVRRRRRAHTWVLSNHDVVRHATRLALTAANPQGHGLGPRSPGLPDVRGRPAPRPRRDRAHARAARLGLPLPGRGARPARGHRPARRRPPGPDLVPHRTASATAATDAACRCPWEADAPSYGFGPTGRLVAAAARAVGRARPRRAARRRRLDALAVPRGPPPAPRARPRRRLARVAARVPRRGRRVPQRRRRRGGEHGLRAPSSCPTASVLLASEAARRAASLPADTTVWLRA